MSLNDTDFAFFAKLLADKSGFFLTPAKMYLLEARLIPVAKKHGLGSLEALAALLRKDSHSRALYETVEAMTTNETLFFRDDKPFKYVRDMIMPSLIQARISKKSLRIWSAACSSGQEPYSLAIMLDEILQDDLKNWRIDILATDISEKVLEQARQGFYTQFEIQRGLPIQMLVKYFTRENDRWKIHEKFRRMVRFEPFNLMQPADSFGKFDLIFCRNVLIYFDEHTKKRVLTNISRCIETDGHMMLGGAETALCSPEHFAVVPDCAGLYRLSGANADEKFRNLIKA